MTLRIFLLLSLSAVSLSLRSQTVTKAPAPRWVTPVTYSTQVKDTTNASNGYIDLLVDNRWNTQTREGYYHYAQKVLSEKGLEYVSAISQYFEPPQTLTFHNLKITRKGKVLDRLAGAQFQLLRREENLERAIYDGGLTAVLNLEDLQVDDIVEYDYTVKGWNPAFGNKFSKTIYFNGYSPIAKIHIGVLAESERKFKLIRFNNVPEPVIKVIGDLQSYEWTLDGIPALVTEESTPAWYDGYHRVDLTEYQTWKDVAQWATELYAPVGKSTPSLNAKIASLKKPEQAETAAACIKFVQDEIRYLSFSDGINGYQPHLPEKVFDQRFGDCKDKSTLLAYMLNHFGIDAAPVLVHSSAGKSLAEKGPSPLQFNHCIVRFILHDSTYWIDPTISLQRGPLKKRYLPDYHYGLEISEKASDLTVIPHYNGPSSITYAEVFDIDTVGTRATLKVTTTYQGDEANTARDQFQSNSVANLTKNYLNFYANDYPEIKSLKNVEFKDDPEQNTFITFEEYEINPFWTYDSAKNEYSVYTYPRGLASYLYQPSTKIRSMPYRLSWPLNIHHTITLNLPEEWSVTESRSKVSSSGFEFVTRKSSGFASNIIELDYQYHTLKSYLDPSEVKDHIAKTKEISDHLTFQLTHQKSAGSAANKSFNGPFAVIGLILLGVLALVARELHRYDPEPQNAVTQYSSLGGWLILPALGLLISPVLVAYGLATNNFFQYYSWQILTDSKYAGYNPTLGILILTELLANITLIVFGALLITLLLTRRTSFPRMVIIYYALNCIVVTGDYFASYALALDIDSAEATKNIFRSIGAAVVWIPYFLNSERVKGTFTVRLNASTF